MSFSYPKAVVKINMYTIKVFSLLLVLILSLFNFGCAYFPFFKNEIIVEKSDLKIDIKLDPIVKHEDGSDYFSLDESLVEYALNLPGSCANECKDELKVNAYFTASSSSEFKYSKVWMWAGVISLGIIPVYEKTKFTLIAEVQNGATKKIKLTQNRHLVSSIFLFPFNIFRSWRKDLLVPQKMLIDQLANDIRLNLNQPK